MMFVELQVTRMVWPVISVLESWPAKVATCTFEIEAPAHVDTFPRPGTGYPQGPPAAARRAGVWSTRHHFWWYVK